jgi:putative DNA primase/helicase
VVAEGIFSREELTARPVLYEALRAALRTNPQTKDEPDHAYGLRIRAYVEAILSGPAWQTEPVVDGREDERTDDRGGAPHDAGGARRDGDGGRPDGDGGRRDGDGTRRLDAQQVEKLAALTPFEYERCREQEAEQLGVRVPILDREVARCRAGGAAADTAEVRRQHLWTVEPWPEPVATGDLLDELVATYMRHVVLPEHGAVTMALWTLHAWTHDAATISPLLAYVSPEKRCGKSTALLLLRYTVPRPLPTANVTAAVVFRAIKAWHPTLLIDEADTFLGEADELRGVINSGHVRGMAQTLRCVGDDHMPETFSTWAPKALALIEYGRGLHDTLADRAIVLEMRRRLPTESVQRLRADQDGAFIDVRRRAARCAADALATLRAAEPEIPSVLHDRAADNWRPLLAIADYAGGAWPRRAREAAGSLSASTGADSARIQLLGDLADVLTAPAGRIPSTTFVECLARMEERPWPEWRHGKPITARQVASLLRPLGIAPRSIRLDDGSTPKGYMWDQAFDDAIARYRPSRSATPPQPAPDAAERYDTIRHTAPTSDDLWRIENDGKPVPDAACGGVADAEGWTESGDYKF